MYKPNFAVLVGTTLKEFGEYVYFRKNDDEGEMGRV